MNPLFSVIIPTFQRSEYVDRAVDSVLKQGIENFELIVVDDGSTDETQRRICSYADDRIKYIRTVHMGVNVARNIGLSMASADWVAFLDSDDYWEKHRLEQIAQEIEQSEDLKIYITNCRWKGSDFSVIPEKYLNSPQFDQFLLSFGSLGGTSNLVAPAKQLMEIGGFDITLNSSQDTDIYYRLTRHLSIAYISNVNVIQDLDSPHRISNQPEDKMAGLQRFYTKHKDEMTSLTAWLGRKKIAVFALRFNQWDTLFRNVPYLVIIKMLKMIHGLDDDMKLIVHDSVILRWIRKR